MKKLIVKNLFTPLVLLVMISELRAQPQALPPIASLGHGTQYEFAEFSGNNEGGGVLITELPKAGIVYRYEQVDEDSWRLIVKIAEEQESYEVFNSHVFELTRLVDVRKTGDRIEVLLSHTRGYYFIVLDKIDGRTDMVFWGSIMQQKFRGLNGSGRDPSVVSVTIDAERKVVIKRAEMADAVFEFNPTTRQVTGEGHNGDRSYFKFVRE